MEKNWGRQRLRLIIFIECGIALKEVRLTPRSEAVSIVAHESVDRGSFAILIHPITAGSAKSLPDWRRKTLQK